MIFCEWTVLFFNTDNFSVLLERGRFGLLCGWQGESWFITSTYKSEQPLAKDNGHSSKGRGCRAQVSTLISCWPGLFKEHVSGSFSPLSTFQPRCCQCHRLLTWLTGKPQQQSCKGGLLTEQLWRNSWVVSPGTVISRWFSAAQKWGC